MMMYNENGTPNRPVLPEGPMKWLAVLIVALLVAIFIASAMWIIVWLATSSLEML